jgi:hypothetical protein
MPLSQRNFLLGGYPTGSRNLSSIGAIRLGDFRVNPAAFQATPHLDSYPRSLKIGSFERLSHRSQSGGERMGKSGQSYGEMLKGTLDMMILRTLVTGDAHGHTIAKLIERIPEDVLEVKQGSPGRAPSF